MTHLFLVLILKKNQISVCGGSLRKALLFTESATYKVLDV